MENKARGLVEPIIESSNFKNETKVYKDGFRILGNQYFKYINDEDVDLIRVVKTINDKEVVVLNDNGETYNISPKEIQDNYELLATDGLITVAVADMGLDVNGHVVEDVVVCLYRKNEMELGDYSPFVICRQNITDFFYNYLSQSLEPHNMCGVSVSRTSCPENVDWEAIRSCNDIRDAVSINIYIEDNVASILSMIKSNKMKIYNRVLESCYDDHLKSFNTPRNRMRKDLRKPIDGFCLTLKELLEVNNFQYDLDSAYNILAIDCNISEVQVLEENDPLFGKYYKLPDDIVGELCRIFKQNITETIVVPYSHEFSIEELAQSKYFILRDNTNRLYIVNYITSGEYRESDLEVIAAKVEMNRVKNLFGSTMNNKYSE